MRIMAVMSKVEAFARWHTEQLTERDTPKLNEHFGLLVERNDDWTLPEQRYAWTYAKALLGYDERGVDGMWTGKAMLITKEPDEAA